jgi:hypothetical protein
MAWHENFIISQNDRRHHKGLTTGLNPKSGLFLESLPGLSLNKAANTATYESAIEFIERLSNTACQQTFDDAIDRMNCSGSLKMIAASVPPLWNGAAFADSFQPGERGLTVTKYNPERQALSTFRITKIHLLAKDAATSKSVTIIDGAARTEFLVDIEAEVPFVLDVVDPATGLPFYVVKDPEKFSVVWDTADIRPAVFSWANTNLSNHLGGCGGCGGNRRSVNSDWYWFSEANGIAVDMAFVCDYTRAATVMAHDLRWAILYRFGVLVCEELLASDRINYFVNNGQEWAKEKAEKWEADYTLRLNQVLPTMDGILRSIDRNCFYTKGNILQQVRV